MKLPLKGVETGFGVEEADLPIASRRDLETIKTILTKMDLYQI